MIIVLKQDAPDAQVREFCHELQDMGLQINDSKGSDTHILGLIGDTKAIAESWVLANPVVETCRRVSEPYKKANRKFHPDDTVVDVGGHKIGGGYFAVIQNHNIIRVRRLLHIMRSQKYRKLFIFTQLAYDPPQKIPRLRIKPGCRLIQNKYFRVVNQRARNIYTPPLTARKLSHGAAQQLLKIQKRRKPGKPFFKLRASYSVKRRAAFEIILYRKLLIQHGILKNNAYAALYVIRIALGIPAADFHRSAVL